MKLNSSKWLFISNCLFFKFHLVLWFFCCWCFSRRGLQFICHWEEREREEEKNKIELTYRNYCPLQNIDFCVTYKCLLICIWRLKKNKYYLLLFKEKKIHIKINIYICIMVFLYRIRFLILNYAVWILRYKFLIFFYFV